VGQQLAELSAVDPSSARRAVEEVIRFTRYWRTPEEQGRNLALLDHDEPTTELTRHSSNFRLISAASFLSQEEGLKPRLLALAEKSERHE
jgi:hypothetical protein